MSEKDGLTGYCGMYCGLCGIRTGEIKTAVARLKELIALYQLDRIAQFFGGIENLPQFMKALDDMGKMFGTCASCRGGGGWQECPMRKCCAQRKLEFCHECEKMPCEDLSTFQRKHFLLPCPHYVKTSEKV